MNSAVAKTHFIASLSPPIHRALALISLADSADTDPLACAQFSRKAQKNSVLSRSEFSGYLAAESARRRA
jgi:hypothetical protein